MTRLINQRQMQDLAAQGKAAGYINEALSAIATLKAAGAEQRALARWSNLFMDQMNISVRRNYLLSIISAWLWLVPWPIIRQFSC